VTRGRISRAAAGRTRSSARSPALSDLDLRIPRSARLPPGADPDPARLDQPRDAGQDASLPLRPARTGGPRRPHAALQLDERELAPNERRAFDALVRHHLARHLDRVNELAESHGEGPALRRAGKRLEEGEFLDRHELSWQLAEEAKRDGQARAEQERLREDYLGWREQKLGSSPRLRASPAACATGRRPSSPRWIAAPCASAEAARRSPIPIPSERYMNAVPAMTLPGAATSAPPRRWRRSSRPSTKGASGEHGCGKLGQEAEPRSRRRPLRASRSTRRPLSPPRPPRRRADRSAPRSPARPLPRLPRRWRT
jgi:hypothetical protein